LLRPGLAETLPETLSADSKLQRDFSRLSETIDDLIQEARLAA
jgi:hypothetical protein